MYFVYRNGTYIDASGQSFRDFMAGKLPALPGEQPTRADWEDQLTVAFPEVRLKRYLEMRGADGGPWNMICALPALWVGLLYDDATLESAWDLVKDWTAADREGLRRDVPRLALHAPFRGGTVQDLARTVLELAEAGLAARGTSDLDGRDERKYLEPLHAIVAAGRTRAEDKLARYESEWGRSVDPLFTHYAY